VQSVTSAIECQSYILADHTITFSSITGHVWHPLQHYRSGLNMIPLIEWYRAHPEEGTFLLEVAMGSITGQVAPSITHLTHPQSLTSPTLDHSPHPPSIAHLTHSRSLTSPTLDRSPHPPSIAHLTHSRSLTSPTLDHSPHPPSITHLTHSRSLTSPIHYTPYTIHHTPYTIHYTPYTIHHTLYTIHYTPHIMLDD
jgi:hypothetical protein